MTAAELAEAVRAEIKELTGGWCQPGFVLTRTGRRNVDTHGWSGGECDAELVSEEAHGYLDRALAAAMAKHPGEFEGRFDEIQTCVLGFYD